jgi:hypothetical protein
MTTWRNPPLDDTWRLICRQTSNHDGRDCYVFIRRGGPDLTHSYSTCEIPVERFWGKA